MKRSPGVQGRGTGPGARITAAGEGVTCLGLQRHRVLAAGLSLASGDERVVRVDVAVVFVEPGVTAVGVLSVLGIRGRWVLRRVGLPGFLCSLLVLGVRLFDRAVTRGQ